MSYSLSFELDKLPPSLNVFMRWHYRKRSAEFKKIKLECQRRITKPESPLASYHITFTRFTTRALDIDNLVASFKPVLDALVNCGVIQDDKWCTTENLSYKQEKVAKMNEHKVRVEVVSKELKNTGASHGKS